MIIKKNLELISFLQNLSSLNANKGSAQDTLQIIIAAKRVEIIDGYAETLELDKFDLVIGLGFSIFFN